jgi:hypothetical protein
MYFWTPRRYGSDQAAHMCAQSHCALRRIQWYLADIEYPARTVRITDVHVVQAPDRASATSTTHNGIRGREHEAAVAAHGQFFFRATGQAMRRWRPLLDM